MNQNLNNILKDAEKERIKLKHPYVGSEHLFMSLIKNENNLTCILKNYGITYELFKKELLFVVGKCKKDNLDNLYTPLLRKIIKRYENKIKNIKQDQYIYENIFIAILDEGEGIAIRILLKMNVDLDELYVNLKEKQKLFEMRESNNVGIYLNSTINMNECIYGREEELDKVILTLSRKKKCNPLLIGPAGVGKTALIEELVRRINKKLVPDSLKNSKVFMIEMGSLISGTKYRGEFEERLNKIIKEIINDKNSIIFIDEIHSMIGAGGAEGAINAGDILKPYLARGEVKVIGATTTNEYNNSILTDKALARRFEVINIKEPSESDMYKLLIKVKKEYENFHNIKISNKILKRLIELSNFYMKNIVNPDKSIDLLDSACAYTKLNSSTNTLTENDLIKTIIYKTNNYLINNDFLVNKIISLLSCDLKTENLNDLKNTLSEESFKPKSILIEDDKIKNIIVDNLNNINIVNIDLNKCGESIFKNINNTEIKDCIFNSIVDNPFSLIYINHISSVSRAVLDEISKINTTGELTCKYNEKIYFNNAILIASIDDECNYTAGFSKRVLRNNLPVTFVNSFSCNLIGSKQKEISYN